MVHEITYGNVVAMAYPAEEQAKGCKRVGQVFTKPVKSFVNVANMSVESTNALDKTCKFIVSILRMVYEVALSVFKVALGPLKLIWEELSAFTGLFGGLNVIGRFGEWLSKKNGKSFGHPSNNTRAKVTSRALLTVAHGIEGGLFLQTYGLVNFARFFNFLGRIPVLGLVVRIPAKIIKDAFVFGSAIFGIVASFQSYNSAKLKAKHGLKKDLEKLTKWTERKEEAQAAVTSEQKLDVIRAHFMNKVHARFQALRGDDGELICPDGAKEEDLLKKETFYAQLLTKYDVVAADEVELNQLMTAHTTRIELKVRLWTEAKGYDEKENVRRAKVRTWVSVAYDIAKICITATMIIGWIVGCSTALGFILTAATIGLISNGLGWGKVIADAKNAEKRAQVADFAIGYISKQTYIDPRNITAAA